MDENLKQLIRTTSLQRNNIYGCDCKQQIQVYAEVALERTQRCLEHYKGSKYILDTVEVSPFHTGHYSIYLWYLSNTAYTCLDYECATLIYCLNKALHAVDWYFEIDLPEWWGVEHPVGSVLGRAKYGNGLFIYQCCTVGGSQKEDVICYPLIGENVKMYAYSAILGDCVIGNNVTLGAGAIVKNENVPSNSLVFGSSPNLTIKAKRS